MCLPWMVGISLEGSPEGKKQDSWNAGARTEADQTLEPITHGFEALGKKRSLALTPKVPSVRVKVGLSAPSTITREKGGGAV